LYLADENFAVVGVPHQQPFTCVCLHNNPHFSCSTLAIVLKQQQNPNIFLLHYKLKFHFISIVPAGL
jgi:hypothetical protein